MRKKEKGKKTKWRRKRSDEALRLARYSFFLFRFSIFPCGYRLIVSLERKNYPPSTTAKIIIYPTRRTRRCCASATELPFSRALTDAASTVGCGVSTRERFTSCNYATNGMRVIWRDSRDSLSPYERESRSARTDFDVVKEGDKNPATHCS